MSGEQPVHGSGMAGIKGETVADAVAHAGHVIRLRGEWGFVDAENLRAEAGEHPCPAAGGEPRSRHRSPGPGRLGSRVKDSPEFEVGPAWRIDLVFHGTAPRRRGTATSTGPKRG